MTVYEASDMIGGQMRLAAYPPGKGDLTNMVRSYMNSSMSKLKQTHQ
ncbi:NADH-dependent flavin oxidoreductase [Listeria monocytogenes N53-1]|nr:NADH-dependent flavin oxidoreductase [Listeria monocytogenes]CCQ24941.1 NADH-dependent flavin oxidoreductase [Listeria monocytogenes N53-1]